MFQLKKKKNTCFWNSNYIRCSYIFPCPPSQKIDE